MVNASFRADRVQVLLPIGRTDQDASLGVHLVLVHVGVVEALQESQQCRQESSRLLVHVVAVATGGQTVDLRLTCPSRRHLVNEDHAIVNLVAQLQNRVQTSLALSIPLAHHAFQRNVPTADCIPLLSHQNHVALLSNQTSNGRLSRSRRAFKQDGTGQWRRVAENEAISGAPLLAGFSGDFAVFLGVFDREDDRVLNVLIVKTRCPEYLLDLVISGDLVPNILLRVHLRIRHFIRSEHLHAQTLQLGNHALWLTRGRNAHGCLRGASALVRSLSSGEERGERERVHVTAVLVHVDNHIFIARGEGRVGKTMLDQRNRRIQGDATASVAIDYDFDGVLSISITT